MGVGEWLIRIYTGRPRLRVRADGWIINDRGRVAVPHARRCWVQVEYEDGSIGDARPNGWLPTSWWRGRAVDWQRNIIAYRIVPSPRAPAIWRRR
jgi:hypothetical protein